MRVAIPPPFRGYVQVCVRSEVTVKLRQAPVVTSTGEAVLPGVMPLCPYFLGSAHHERSQWQWLQVLLVRAAPGRGSGRRMSPFFTHCSRLCISHQCLLEYLPSFS